ncbi:MAG: DEAD/DEAH box helicase [Patescibacteria group bacterium]|nr:DEAD/DEAH box helicase [Patescibacteria group bacterium]
MELRPYQLELIDRLTEEAGKGHRRLLLQLFMGGGKTVIVSQIISHAAANGKHVLFLAHRRELVDQAAEKLEKFGIEPSIMRAGDPYDPTLPVIVASLPTLHSWVVRRKTERVPKADLVVFDEAHHVASKTWANIAALYPDAIILGMTATPQTKTGKGLAAHFDVLVKGPTVEELINDGYLVPVRYLAPSIPDLQGVKVVAGDYTEKDLARKLDKVELIGDVCQNWLKFASDRKTLVFGSGVQHSQHICARFNELGVRAAHIDGKTPAEERDRVLKDFKEGSLQVLSNCMVYTEGTDLPMASALILARPTKSQTLYFQMVGRALRTHSGKKDALILDHSGTVYDLGKIEWPVDWELTYNTETEKSKRLQKQRRVKRAITCQKCQTIYEHRPDCPTCGTIPEVKGAPVKTYDAYLQYLDGLEKPKGPPEKEWFLMLKKLGEIKGYNPGWCSWSYKEKFARWPGPTWKSLPGIAPTKEVWAWVRARQDQYKLKRRAQAVYPVSVLANHRPSWA